MTIFWLSAAALIGLALLFVVPPLLSRRDRSRDDPDRDEFALTLFHRQLQELDADLAAGALDRQQYQTARQDLERELLHDLEGTPTEPAAEAGGGRWTAVLLAVLLPTVAVSLYLYLGNSDLIPRLAAATAGPQAPAAHPGPQGEIPPLKVMVQRLGDKLERHPDNLEGWMMLGRTYFVMGQPQRALQALERAYDLAPDNPDVLVAYAEAIAANHGSALAGRPAELIQAALKIDPEHTGARWLEGLVSFQAARYDQAVEQWEALLATFDPESTEAAELTRYITQARSRPRPEQAPEQVPAGTETGDTAQGTPPNTADAAKPERPAGPQPAAATAGVRVEVSLAESLWPQANMNDSLFIYAKAAAGPPMPLAVHRGHVRDLPLTITLTDAMTVIPTMKLSEFDQVTIGARISKSGQATPQSGDLEGEVSMVKPGQIGIVKILIDRVRH
ncbi:c-type cytochrome biogenesis protein CcmI [Candidatus Thiosymbion oneisti]|uniref:c-type cytochrome biogenesis protein CcmI n=1 Tax=Candidatus Thiosymbion oneisti TaxID=589554 RepID=UPI000B7C9C37|nr:c-type cytochrome biogenesis protein CcmI [Candidatus Thiosymbion oneisti]